MKKQFILLTTLLAFVVNAQQTTLQHFNPNTITPIVESYQDAGYFTGHNDYGDEEFAEKYEINGSAKLVGISAIHLGQDGTSGTLKASYRAYSVGTTGLPQSQIANKDLGYNEIPVNGELNTVLFDNSIDVEDQFFVSFRLGDYAHGGLGTKRIAISHSPDQTRSTEDLEVYARNVIRWHSHGAATWKDYRTENFSDYEPAIHFSIFPIVELDALSVIDFNQKGQIGAVFPNPSNGNFTIPISSKNGGETELKLFDVTGRLISTKKTQLKSGKNDFIFSEENLPKGIYVLWIKTPEGSISQRVSIK